MLSENTAQGYSVVQLSVTRLAHARLYRGKLRGRPSIWIPNYHRKVAAAAEKNTVGMVIIPVRGYLWTEYMYGNGRHGCFLYNHRVGTQPIIHDIAVEANPVEMSRMTVQRLDIPGFGDEPSAILRHIRWRSLLKI